MKILTEEEFKVYKKSDTIFVLGSGWSINYVSGEEWNIVSQHDSIGFNWFCKHSFEPTWFLIREQANLPMRKAKGETHRDLIAGVEKYKNTYGIICDVSNHTKEAYRWQTDKRLHLPCIVVRDDNKKRHGKNMKKYMLRNPMESGLIHGSCTMYNVMHFVKWMGYKRVIFLGVDLLNSRYFWLKKHETRHTVSKKGRSYVHKHAVTTDVLLLMSKFKRFEVEMFYVYRKSLLRRLMPQISFDQIK